MWASLSMTRWGVAVASGCIALAVWGCVLLAHLMRPLPQLLYPRESPPLMAVGRLDTLAGHLHCEVEYRLVKLDR